MFTSWGVEILESGFADPKAICWSCLKGPVPDVDDHIGLCDECLARLRSPD
jgi:hypothetical protein